MSSYDQANTSLNSFSSTTIAILSLGHLSFATFTGHGSSMVSRLTSSNMDAFTRWETAGSFSKASCACLSSRITSWSSSVSSSSWLITYDVTAYTTSTSNNAMSLGFSVRYWSTFSSANSSNIFIASTYKGVNYLHETFVTQTFVLAWQKLMTFLCQFFLMRAVFSQGLPSSMGYSPGALSFRTSADIRNAWPPMVILRFRISLVGWTELVSAILNQNGHGSHSWIPNSSHVLLLITFTPEPPWMIVLGTSFPLIITATARLFSSIMVGPSLGFVKYIGTIASVMNINSSSNLTSLYIYISARQTLDFKPLYKEKYIRLSM